MDGDGKLNREELSAFLNPENYKHMHKVLVEVSLYRTSRSTSQPMRLTHRSGRESGVTQVTMVEKDLNKDGAIDLKEFLGEMADNQHSDWYTAEKDRCVLVFSLSRSD